MRPKIVLPLLALILALITVVFSVQLNAQTVSILQPIKNATIWGNQLTARWTADEIQITPADGTTNPNQAHFHLFLSKGKEKRLDLTPGQPIGNEAIHTTETSHTFTNLSAGTYTLQVVLADGNHIPLDPPVQASVQFIVRPPDEQPTADLPNWLIVTAVGALLLVVVLLTRTF